jgi:hypothetical protein
MLISPQHKDHKFHDASTETGNGKAFKQNDANQYKTLTVEIFGSEDNTARTVTFYGKGLSGALRPIAGIKVSAAPMTTALNSTGTGELWQFDISGMVEVVMDLTAITGGSVSVYGRAVSI